MKCNACGGSGFGIGIVDACPKCHGWGTQKIIRKMKKIVKNVD